MSIAIPILIIVVIVGIFVVSLCAIAADADERLGYK